MQIFPSGESHGALVRALAISIVFHLLLLWPAAMVWEPATPPAPLVASLRPGETPAAPAQPPPPHHPAPVPRAATPVMAAPAASEPLPEMPAPVPPRSTTPAPAGSEPQTKPVETEPRVAVASALPPSAGIDAEGLRGYRMALAVEARRHKRYPVRAIEEGWSGTTELRIRRVPGQAVLVDVIKPSGYPLLDEAALDMMRRALPATPVPASLRERAFSIDLPIVFDLPQ